MPIADLTAAEAGPDARRVLSVTGPDASTFLQGVLTADVSAWSRDRALPAALLTRKGQIVAEAVAVADPSDGQGTGVWLVVPSDVAEEVLGILDKYLVMDDAVVAAADGIDVAFAWSDDAPAPAVSSAPAGVIVPTVHPAPGVLVVGPRDWIRDHAGASPWAGHAAFDRYRVESHRPGWRREIVPGRLPPEVGFADAVSYEKGCYLGQEPLARIHARGGVRRVLVAVSGTLAADAPLPLALSAESRADAGRLSSWVVGPDGGRGLALVHRDAAVPGTVLVPREAATGTLQVCTGPIGDDPGIGADRKARAKEVRAQLRRGR